MFEPPCRVLIGPLFNPALIGRYAQHAQVRTFMPQSAFTEKYRYDYVYNPYTIRHFNQIFEQISDGWEPDLVIWWDPVYQAMPPGIEECPYPTALIPGDWNLAFLTVLQAARSVDGVLRMGVWVRSCVKQGFPTCSPGLVLHTIRLRFGAILACRRFMMSVLSAT